MACTPAGTILGSKGTNAGPVDNMTLAGSNVGPLWTNMWPVDDQHDAHRDHVGPEETNMGPVRTMGPDADQFKAFLKGHFVP